MPAVNSRAMSTCRCATTSKAKNKIQAVGPLLESVPYCTQAACFQPPATPHSMNAQGAWFTPGSLQQRTSRTTLALAPLLRVLNRHPDLLRRQRNIDMADAKRLQGIHHGVRDRRR